MIASIALGALIGASLAVWVAPASDGARELATARAGASGAQRLIPGDLISGATSPARPPIHTIDNRVFVVGDSVMQGAAPYLADSLKGWSIIADTRVGRFLDEAIRVVEKRRADIGEIVVLNLGNNYNGSETQFAAEVSEMLDLLAGVSHVIWMNVGEFKADRVEVNDTLRAAAETHKNLTLVDWNSWWSENRSFTSGDRLHLTPDGADAYAALVAAAVTRVTQAAGEIPAPGAKEPKLNTSGRIPSGSNSSSSGASTRRSSGSSSSRRRATTTVPPQTPDDPGDGTPTKPPSGSGTTVAPSTPPTTRPPATTQPSVAPPTTQPPVTPPGP